MRSRQSISPLDIAGQIAGLPLCKLLGGQRLERIPAYVSGLPKPTRTERAALAVEWQKKGFDSFKFASPVADDGVGRGDRHPARGPRPQGAHLLRHAWAHKAGEARMMIRAMEAHGLWFAEAPVAPEDIAGLAEVAQGVSCPVAAGARNGARQ